MKTILISTAAVFAAAPVLAGPYVNVEANSKFDAGDYSSVLIEKHVGYAGNWVRRLLGMSKVVLLPNSMMLPVPSPRCPVRLVLRLH